MRKTNYHTHTRLGDGSNTAEEMINAAISNNYAALGFSDHAPLPYPTHWAMKDSTIPKYFNVLSKLKLEYQSQIDVYIGSEIDYIPEIMGPSVSLFPSHLLDFTIGSIHSIKDTTTGQYYEINSAPAALQQLIDRVFQNDIQAFVYEYYRRVQIMVTQYNPTIIGHLDVLKKNNRHNEWFDEQLEWYRAIVHETLEIIAKSTSILEVNTGGLARYRALDLYPSLWILKEAYQLNIPVTVSTDAHSIKKLDSYYDRALHDIRMAGYNEIYMLLDNCWQPYRITD